jgi:hypothetical protein
MKSRAINLFLLLASSAMGVLGAEAAFRIFLPGTPGYYVLAPGTDRTFRPSPELMRGVSGPARYRVNEFGIRGPLFGNDGSEYRVLAVGGSTTECAYLDEDEVWTAQLAAALVQNNAGLPLWVGNVGRSGTTSRDHAVQVKYLLRQYPRIDMVLVLVVPTM